MPLARADELRSQAALEEAALALHMALMPGSEPGIAAFGGVSQRFACFSA